MVAGVILKKKGFFSAQYGKIRGSQNININMILIHNYNTNCYVNTVFNK